MNKVSSRLEQWKEKRDLAKRIEKLEQTVNKLQITIDIALDSRVSYLETKFVELKHMKPALDKVTTEISSIKGAVESKKKELPDSNQEIEVA